MIRSAAILGAVAAVAARQYRFERETVRHVEAFEREVHDAVQEMADGQERWGRCLVKDVERAIDRDAAA
jgi:hypothetical protein